MSPTHFTSTIITLLLASLITGFGHIALLPPFEGFDETAHYAYIQQVAETGTWPRRGDKMSTEIDDYLRVAPTSDQMSPTWTYYRFFSEGGDRAAARDMIHSRAAPPKFEPGTIGNWQAQHPPVYYAALAPIYLLSKKLSLANRLFVLRASSYLLAWGALCFVALRALGGNIPDRRAAAALPLALAAWPILFPGWFPEMGRLGNDSLVTVFSACALLLLYRIASGAPTMRDYALLGLVLALGLLTKATFIPVAAAAFAVLALLVLLSRATPDRCAHTIKGFCICAAVVLGASGWWYLTKLFETGSVIGSNDAANFDASAGLISGIVKHFDPRVIVLVPWGLITTFLWSGTWSFVLPPRAFLIPLVALAAGIALGYFREIRRAPLRPMDWFVVLTIGLFLAGIVCYSLILFSLMGVAQPTWYLHSLAPIVALAVGYGLANVMRTSLLRTALAALVCFALAFLPAMITMNVLYYTGCAPKLPERLYFGWRSATACLTAYPTMYENLTVIASPALGIVLFTAGWVLLVVGAVMMLGRAQTSQISAVLPAAPGQGARRDGS